MHRPAITKAPPPPISVPDIIATDDDEGNTGANSLLASEALRVLGSSQTSSLDTERAQSSQYQRSSLDEIVVLPDSTRIGATLGSPSSSRGQTTDRQPLLQWRQTSPPHRLRRRQSELQISPSRIEGDLQRSMSDTADTSSPVTNQALAFRRDTSQPFYGVEPRRPVRRDLSSKLLNNMHIAMHAPQRQRSLLSRISPIMSVASHSRGSSDHESADSGPEIIEMSTLSRIASEGPESSSGSILVEVSPDSYEPLQPPIWGRQIMPNQLPVMPEEEAEVCC